MLLLAAAALSATPVPLGRFTRWSPGRDHPVRLIWGAVAIDIAPLPCPAVPANEGCRYEHVNNQVAVTVRAPGVAPVRVVSDRQGSYVRVAAVRFDRRDPRPGVVVESQYGGSAGVVTVQLLAPTARGYRVIPLDRAGGLQGQLADAPADVDGDGVAELVYADGRFAQVFGCNACTPRPPLVFAVRGGRLVDESRAPGVRAVYRRDLAVRRARCLSDQPERNGACAAWMADAARAGGFDRAWAEMLGHYDRRAGERWPVGGDGGSFPESLQGFLRATGYRS